MRDSCFRSLMGNPPPPEQAWDGSTSEHVKVYEIQVLRE